MANEVRYARLIQRQDTKQNWQTVNPLLESGEFGYDSDAMDFKVGNGIDTWNQLPYYSETFIGITDWNNIRNKPNMNDYYQKNEVYNKQQIDSMLGAITTALQNI